MELKCTIIVVCGYGTVSFNRTFMELKYPNSVYDSFRT